MCLKGNATYFIIKISVRTQSLSCLDSSDKVFIWWEIPGFGNSQSKNDEINQNQNFTKLYVSTVKDLMKVEAKGRSNIWSEILHDSTAV